RRGDCGPRRRRCRAGVGPPVCSPRRSAPPGGSPPCCSGSAPPRLTWSGTAPGATSVLVSEPGTQLDSLLLEAPSERLPHRLAEILPVPPHDADSPAYPGPEAGKRRYSKTTEMLSLLRIRRMASAKSGATDTTSTFRAGGSGWVSTLSVTSSFSIGLWSRRWLASEVSREWVTAAKTRLAPRSFTTR